MSLLEKPKNKPVKPVVTRGLQALGIVAGLLCVVVFIDYLFALAGVHFISGWWKPVEVEPVTVQARGHVISAIAGLIGGAAALITFTLTYRQKQNHFEQQRKQEQAQSDYEAIAAEYDALSKDFVAKEELARINAAIGLAAIAKKVDPRKEFSPQDSEKTNELYPWYERVAMQLAAALTIYDESRARDQVRISIRDIARLDNEPGMQPLLTFLINTLADANRTAYKTFLDTYAEGMACGKSIHLRTFSRAVTIFRTPLGNANMLNDLRKQGDFRLALRANADKRKLSPKYNTPGDPDVKYLVRLRTSSQQLADTRDAIADCVTGEVSRIGVIIPNPDIAIVNGSFDQDKFQTWITLQRQVCEELPYLELDQCFLRGARLGDAQLQGAGIRRAQLQGASLNWAQLQGASLRSAQLQGANLYEAQLQGANLHDAKLVGARLKMSGLQGASLYGTQLQGALLDWSKLQGANLRLANLDGASLERARLEGANLEAARFNGASLRRARLAGANFGRMEPKGIMWQDADLRVYETDVNSNEVPTDRRDTELIRQLRKLFPDGGPKEGEKWPDGSLHEEDYSQKEPEPPVQLALPKSKFFPPNPKSQD